jgi:hypothetical protein
MNKEIKKLQERVNELHNKENISLSELNEKAGLMKDIIKLKNA